MQAALAAGHLRIAGQVPVYPARLNHNALAQSLIHKPQGQAQAGAQLAAQLAALARQFDRSKAACGIISAEHFEFVAPEDLQAALATHMPQYQGRIRLIAYVRPHAPRLIASFAEMTKLGRWTGTLTGFAEQAITRRSYHYAPRFARWRAVFGDAFILRPYLRAHLEQGDVVADVANVIAAGKPWQIAGQTGWQITPQIGPDESPGLSDLVALRMMHGLIPGGVGKGRQMLGRTMGQLLSASVPAAPAKLQLHHTLAVRLTEVYRDDAAELDAAFFPGSPFSRALEQAVSDAADIEQSLDPTDHFDPEAIRQIALWADVFGQLITRDEAHFSWAASAPARRPAVFAGHKTAAQAIEDAPDLDSDLDPDSLSLEPDQADGR